MDGRGEINTDYRSGTRIGEEFGEVARSACDIEDIVGGLDGGGAHCPTPPALIEPKGMHAIVEVVRLRDRGEHRLHFRGFVGAMMRIILELLRLPDCVGHSGRAV